MDLVALEEIRQVKHRYLRCVDLKLWDDLADTFTQDATADYGTKFLIVAGLLNFIAVADAYHIAIGKKQ